MKSKIAFGRTKNKAVSLIDLQGKEGGEVIMRVGGHKFDTINMRFDHPEFHGKPNGDETKTAMMLKLLEGRNQHKVNKIMKLMTPEELLHLFLSYKDYERLAEASEEQLDSEPHNKVAMAEKVVKELIEPFGMSWEVTNSSLGVSIEIGIKGHNYQLN